VKYLLIQLGHTSGINNPSFPYIAVNSYGETRYVYGAPDGIPDGIVYYLTDAVVIEGVRYEIGGPVTFRGEEIE
jgi:hypothetical protein